MSVKINANKNNKISTKEKLTSEEDNIHVGDIEIIKPKFVITKKKTLTSEENTLTNTNKQNNPSNINNSDSNEILTDLSKIKKSITTKPKKKNISHGNTTKMKEHDKNESQEIVISKEILKHNEKEIPDNKAKTKEEKYKMKKLLYENEIDYKYLMANYDFTKNTTMPKITIYEKTVVIGTRATQIEAGAIPAVEVLPGESAVETAEKELRERKIPFIIRRQVGNKFEYWRPKDMEVNMD
jgi:DNA-directed RNA polymerase subunit K/omega